MNSFDLKIQKENTLLLSRDMTAMVSGPPQNSATPHVVLGVNCLARLPRQWTSLKGKCLGGYMCVSR